MTQARPMAKEHSDAWWRANDMRGYVVERKLDHLAGMAEGIVADGIVTEEEARKLRAWLQRNHGDEHPFSARLMQQVEAALADGVLDDDESQALHDALMEWTGGEVESGEVAKSTKLPLDPGPREVKIAGSIFVFTGTGVFGTRTDMRAATEAAGGEVGANVTKKTDYVVLGTYVTASWIHQSFGRKIEKAVYYRDERATGLKIVHEEDWARAIKAAREHSLEAP